MNGRVFVDSNILVYAHDADAGPKREIASERLSQLWNDRRGVISTQVLQEFYVNVTRKVPSTLPRFTARQIIKLYARWHIELIEWDDVLLASEIEESHQIGFWDALIVAAARKGGAATILSEDLNPGQTIYGVLVENPFLR